MNQVHAYELAGVRIESSIELPLPGTAAKNGGAGIRVEMDEPLPTAEAPSRAEWLWKSYQEAVLSYPSLGRARVSNGRSIVLRPCRSPEDRSTEWRGLLIPCFAAIFHQRGALCLHASAVCRNGKAYGLMGPCGAGKSTLVASLVGNGTEFLSDDLLLVEPGKGGKGFLAHPGFSIIKLWDDSLKRTGSRFSRLGRLYPDAVKEGFVPSPADSVLRTVPLEALYVLRDGDEIAVKTLPKCDALGVLLENSYGAQVFEGKPMPLHFRQCGELAANVPVRALTRPRKFAALAAVRNAVIESMDTV